MLRLLFRLLVIALIIWVVATVISPSYDLPNTVLRAGKFAPGAAFDFLFTATVLLLCVTRWHANPFRWRIPKEFLPLPLLALTCVLLC